MALTAKTRHADAEDSRVMLVDGALIATVELGRHPTAHQPLDHLWLFRSEVAWSFLTVSRTERWSDDGNQDLPGCSARVFVERMARADDLGERVRHRYGEPGWRDLLDAGHADPDLFRAWVPGAIAHELQRATFYRPDLVAAIGRFSSNQLEALRVEINEHLCAANFEVVAVEPPNRPTRRGENVVMAHAVVRRYGYEVVTVARMDRAGEVYLRVTAPSEASGSVLQEVDDDDE